MKTSGKQDDTQEIQTKKVNIGRSGTKDQAAVPSRGLRQTRCPDFRDKLDGR